MYESLDKNGSMETFHGLKAAARWSYFVFSFLSILGAFVHLNIQFEVDSCKGDGGPGYDCVGRNLAWLTRNDLKTDINEVYWRSVFSLEPNIFVNVWTPFAFAFLSFCQNFHGFKWDLIAGTWVRTLFFILFWHLFGVIGYAANWGVFVGLWGILWLGLLYFLLAVLKVWKGDENEQPVLQLEPAYYLYAWFGIGKLPSLHTNTRGGSFANGHNESFNQGGTDPAKQDNAAHDSRSTHTYQDIGSGNYQQIDSDPIQESHS
ncbi:hypothetical protein RFI_04065 [Reticulomyxa filosa]|uniref:Uncharacterized protein n=1 Tax=Reticulomyxa filosa TaxID=46433 RepID=X6P5Z8_RETFI|nr:hypothetical protein RFI_04065 [Reticulomyxa filosa]|eukprot:ETO33042.1 hypothetical protein RFI_04065 [Reticulomyxa filosa]